MMHRSDNFYADQILLMVSQLKRGEMNEGAIIDDLLSKELSSMPVLPRWIDGSGLSRYNLFSPSDMIHVLEKMRNELPWNRIAAVFPQSAEGTLRSISGLSGKSIIAKTGSMGGVLCLSGYVLSKQKKWLSFSIMINNHSSSGTVLRKKIGTFLRQL
jgi:D-alanyl-D-alanine carboxypeptidase/D-alanyl-D-alanine-endopeptidase (penicillin-binding protein 4)